MLRNDREALAEIVRTIGEGRGITRLRILDHNGRIGFSTEADEIGRTAVLPGAGVPIQQSRVFSSDGSRILGITTPIENDATCSSGTCHAHPESQRLLGALDVNLSLAEVDAEVRHASSQFIGYSLMAVVVTLATIGALVWHFVHEPVRLLRDGTIQLGRGDLGVQIPVRSKDELGELAASFNQMTRQLRLAREESNAWARTLEERVRGKTLELQRAQEQMIQAEKLTSLGKLAAVVAHEINNPLSGILTYAKLLRKWVERGETVEQRGQEMRESLQLIENESRRCGEIVRDLLTFARVQPLNVTDFDINAVIHQTIKLVEHKLELGNITRRLELGGGLPKVRGDAGQIEQLLLALIMNAIEAMPHEGELRVATVFREGAVEVVIEDNGIGIPPDLVPRLFEPFTTTKEAGKGVGLGLAISRAIVDRHGGTIRVSSEPGRGTAFTVTLPCIVAPAPLPTSNRQPPAAC
jgi:two-component system NtrC family sensor kinase